eukprot:TRINITY_DN6161_c0_g1_i2.p4 TRINITY_DN6161_c0_g1~~TRINITY_DN6161_c0_g1_i2.p4  ORF type:complete len:136 (+),score=20.84 TRINITY_DN6161_c0_g1_i2:234-641(+)
MGSNVSMVGDERCAVKSGHGCSVCDSNKGVEAGDVGVHQGPIRYIEEIGIGERNIETVSSSIEGGRCSGAGGTGRANWMGALDLLGDGATRSGSESGHSDCVEGGTAARWGEVWKLGRKNFIFTSAMEVAQYRTS